MRKPYPFFFKFEFLVRQHSTNTSKSICFLKVKRIEKTKSTGEFRRTVFLRACSGKTSELEELKKDLLLLFDKEQTALQKAREEI